MTESPQEEIYRRYCRGDATKSEVEAVFGEEFEEFQERREFISLVNETPTNDLPGDLIDDTSSGDECP
jgi:hypothetical protein